MTKAWRWAGAVLAAAFAVAVCVAIGQLSYQFYEIYGPETLSPGSFGSVLSAAVVVVPAALLVAAVLTGGSALAGWPARRPGFLLTAGLALVLTAALAAGGAWLGTQAKIEHQRAAAAACSPQEREALRALGTVPEDGVYGIGMHDGSCRGYLAFENNSSADVRLAEVRRQVAAEGWQVTDQAQEGRTKYRKEGHAMEMIVVHDKAVEVTFSLS